jgi:hypothetical protein
VGVPPPFGGEVGSRGGQTTSSAMVQPKAIEAARRRPGGSAAGTWSMLSRTIPVQPRDTGSTCRWGLQGPGSRCDPRATWLCREGARWLYCTPTSLALLVTYSTLHKMHLAARVAQSRPRSTPRWSRAVRLRGRRVTSAPVPATAAKRRCEDDLRRKGARKDEQMRSLERGLGSTDGMKGLHRLQQGR